MDIELFDINRHDVDAIKIILSMAMGNTKPEDLDSLLFEFYSDDNHPFFVYLENNMITGIIGLDYSGYPSGYKGVAEYNRGTIRSVGFRSLRRIVRAILRYI